MAARRRTRRRGLPALKAVPEESVVASDRSLHDLFQQQIRTMLDCTDLNEEQKAGILVAAACPCCGAGGMSFSARLKRRS